MNALESFLQKIKKPEFTGDNREKEIDKLGKNILKLLDKIAPGDKYKEEWKSFDYMKAEFIGKINQYSGKYSDYFQNVLKSIEEQERQALGYHIHAD